MPTVTTRVISTAAPWSLRIRTRSMSAPMAGASTPRMNTKARGTGQWSLTVSSQ